MLSRELLKPKAIKPGLGDLVVKLLGTAPNIILLNGCLNRLYENAYSTIAQLWRIADNLTVVKQTNS